MVVVALLLPVQRRMAEVVDGTRRERRPCLGHALKQQGEHDHKGKGDTVHGARF